MTEIFQRFGLRHNKTFAIPLFVPHVHIFSLQKLFNANMTLGYAKMKDNKSWKGFDLLVNHARMNRREMDKVIHQANYITMLRHPISQFKSAFRYFGITPHILMLTSDSHETDIIEKYLDNPDYYYHKTINTFFHKPEYFYHQLRYLHHFHDLLWNGQAFDLGLDHNLFLNLDYINGAIKRLMKELDLVLIMEYFDESLILLKHYLQLDFQDILYIPSNVKKGEHINAGIEIDKRIASWNKVDIMLYNTFNQTFWKKVNMCGSKFHSDLQLFRELNSKIRMECNGKLEYSQTFRSLKCFDLHQSETVYAAKIRSITKRRLNINDDVEGDAFVQLTQDDLPF